MNKKLFATVLLIPFLFSFNNLHSQGFLKRDNKKIVKGNGEEILLRGIGLGAWMLQEPYMLGISATNQKDIRKKIEALMGKANTDTFYAAWRKNLIQKKDIDSLASWGFNSVRLVMHYNLYTLPIEEEPVAGKQTWLEEGFILTDSLLSWCAANKIYVILDLHAAPGGQGKDAAISDYDSSLPSLWESEANKVKTIALWKKLAERYKDSEWIGAYDLINEPNWDFENSGNQNGCNCTQNKPLLDFYKRLIDTIRKVDTNHLIIVEGNCWGNNYNGMQSLFSYDPNLAVSFHKYWNYNTPAAIQGLLNIRNTYNVPIWCGESGENSNHWYTEAIRLLEANNIGWSWWTLKKVRSLSGIMSIEPDNNYTTLLNYWKNGGTKPTEAFTKSTLMNLTEKIKLENCKINYSVLDAMFRQVQTTQTLRFANNTIPGILYAADYDYGRNGYAYWDTDTANYRVSTGTHTNWNLGYAYRNDGVDIEPCTDSERTNGYNVGWTAAKEWLKYTITVTQTGAYKLNVRHAGNGSQMSIHLDETDISGILTLPSTGGWQNWKTQTFDDIILTEGEHALKIQIVKEGSNLNYIELLYDKPVTEVGFKILSASTDISGKKIIVNLNKSLQTTSFNLSDWIVSVNDQPYELSSISKLNDRQIQITLTNKVLYAEVVKLSFQGNSVLSTDNSILQTIQNLGVLNNLPIMYTLPAKIEAENYYQQSGLSAETCNEGGQNMGYTNSGDYLDYLIIVKKSGEYTVMFRVAAQNSGGVIELQLFDDNNNKTTLGTFNVPSTGGWQNWTTINGKIQLNEGNYRLRIYIKSPEFNINWFSITPPTKVSSYENKSVIKMFPNPCREKLSIVYESKTENLQLLINDLQGKTFASQTLYADSKNTCTLDLSFLKEGLYVVNIYDKKGITYFAEKLAIIR
ncbi:MAG: carbohydrate-binding protein [Bacteroidales bacterium]|nr:carbohydrate-binding protein [Bacteroidales bacterium]